MTTTSERPRATQRTAKPEGQWAKGEFDPLNPNEVFKAEDAPLNVRARILEQYAREGFDSIPGTDLRGRMRWMGLYTQRKQGIDGGKTATLAPEELDDEYFMMRVRIDGGQLSREQLRVLASISTDFARGTADITDRNNIQYHWIAIEDVPEIWRRLEAVGLDTLEACGDCTRTTLGSPVAGVHPDEVIDATPAIEFIKANYVGDPDLANLPRKFKSSIAWLPDAAPEINDISFVGVVHPDHGPGFDLQIGGGLSTKAFFALRLGAWVPLEEVPEVWLATVKLFRDHGYRRLRNRARLKYLVEDWGADKTREVLEREYLGRPLLDGPAAPTPKHTIDHVGVHRQKDGRNLVGFAPIAGRTSGAALAGVADAMEAAGSDRLRLTAYQKLVVLDVPDDAVEPLLETMRPLGFDGRPSPWRRATMACTGLEFCKLAIVETKQRAHDLVAELEERLGHLDDQLEHPIAIHLNGCPNSCARIQVADIGLKGQIITDAAGEQVPGYQVHLGGGLGEDLVVGRKLRAHKVAASELGDYVERVVTRYIAARESGESFGDWARRADEEELR